MGRISGWAHLFNLKNESFAHVRKAELTGERDQQRCSGFQIVQPDCRRVGYAGVNQDCISRTGAQRSAIAFPDIHIRVFGEILTGHCREPGIYFHCGDRSLRPDYFGDNCRVVACSAAYVKNRSSLQQIQSFDPRRKRSRISVRKGARIVQHYRNVPVEIARVAYFRQLDLSWAAGTLRQDPPRGGSKEAFPGDAGKCVPQRPDRIPLMAAISSAYCLRTSE